MPNSENHIARACRAFGSQAKLAGAIGVTSSMVNQMVKGARPVPADKCPLIERVTGGAVRCEDLRPDVDWAYLRGTAVPAVGRAAAVQGN